MKKNSKASENKKLYNRNVKRGAISIAVTVLVIAALVLINVITSSLTSRYSLYIDSTANKAYRLQDTTAEFAMSLDKDKKIELYVLADETTFEGYGDYYVQANKLIHQLSECTDNIDLKYVDLTINPSFTAKYTDVDWTSPHLCLAVCGDRYKIIDAEDMFDYELDSTYQTYVPVDQHIEQALATAILTVTSESLTKVSVLTGQNEIDMSAFETLLKNNVYEVEKVDLNTGEIAEDSEFLIIYAPAVDIDADMKDYIEKWLENDGDYGHNLLYFPSDKKDTAEFPNLNAIIADWGMSVDFGYIYESDKTYIAASLGTSLCSKYNYADEDFTKDLKNPEIPVYLYYTLPVNITDPNTARAMLTTSEKAFFGPMTDEVPEDFEPEYKTLNGAAIGTKNNGKVDDLRKSCVVVVGSYDALSEAFLTYNSYNNAAYFVNVIRTLSSHKNTSVIIEGKNLDSAKLNADNADSVDFIGVIVRWIIPFAVLAAGLAVFLLRRFR